MTVVDYCDAGSQGSENVKTTHHGGLRIHGVRLGDDVSDPLSDDF
jgi:hypothetical protein